MPEMLERRIDDLTIRIDRSLCVGFGHCVEEAQETFRLGADGLATFSGEPARVQRDVLLRACAACPVEAITAYDEGGAQLAL